MIIQNNIAAEKCGLKRSDGQNKTASMNSGSVFTESALKNQANENGIIELEKEFNEVEKKQGIIGKAWNGVKNLFGFGLSSKDVEKAINDYKNGNISLEEAKQTVDSFDKKQKGAVDIITNVAGGVITASTAVATGGLSLGAVAVGAAIGGASKAGIKTVDRATNEVKGDALDVKQIAKDGLTGAVDGAMTVATAGMVKGAVAGQTVKEAVKQGVIQGAKAGALTGAATGAANYTADAIFEEDIEFNAANLFKTSFQNAAFGALAGGVMGGISNGVSQNKLNKTTSKVQIEADSSKPAQIEQKTDDIKALPDKSVDEELLALEDTQLKIGDDVTVAEAEQIVPTRQIRQEADELKSVYESHIGEFETEYKQYFDGLKSVEEVSARAKGTDSIAAKLESKYKKGAYALDIDTCAQKIGDGYGVRVQLASITDDEARQIVTSKLKNGTYEDFLAALQSKEPLSSEYLVALDALKERQMGEFVETFASKIRSGEIVLGDEAFNNYGNEISSYLTNRQLREIADAYNAATGKVLNFVNRDQILSNADGVAFADARGVMPQVTEEQIGKAIKDSGYVSSQVNIQTTKTNGAPLADMELQIRGTKVNGFADVEHIPYDIRQGKITIGDKKYSDIFASIKGMSKESYSEYNKYLTDVYNALRLRELGIPVEIPKLTAPLYYAMEEELAQAGLNGVVKAGGQLSEEAVQKLTMDGLSLYSKK